MWKYKYSNAFSYSTHLYIEDFNKKTTKNCLHLAGRSENKCAKITTIKKKLLYSTITESYRGSILFSFWKYCARQYYFGITPKQIDRLGWNLAVKLILAVRSATAIFRKNHAHNFALPWKQDFFLIFSLSKPRKNVENVLAMRYL